MRSSVFESQPIFSQENIEIPRIQIDGGTGQVKHLVNTE